jgi:hypothetical protein
MSPPSTLPLVAGRLIARVDALGTAVESVVDALISLFRFGITAVQRKHLLSTSRCCNVANQLVPGIGSCPAEHHSGHNKDEAVASHTIAVIMRFSGGVDNRVMRLICTI